MIPLQCSLPRAPDIRSILGRRAVNYAPPRPAWFLSGHERGVAALEFALASPLLCLMIGGTFVYGYAYFCMASLANAVQAGAQFASVERLGASTSAFTATDVENIVKSMMQVSVSGTAAVYTATSQSTSGPWPSGYSQPGWYCLTTNVGGGNVLSAASPVTTQPANTTKCPDGSLYGYYIAIAATFTTHDVMGGSLIAQNIPITQTTLVRTQ